MLSAECQVSLFRASRKDCSGLLLGLETGTLRVRRPRFTFTEMDLSRLRQGDWLNLQEDMRAFLGWSPRSRETLTPESLTPLRNEGTSILQGIAQTFAPQGRGDRTVHLPKVLSYGDVKPDDIFRLIGKDRRGVALGVKKVEFLYFDFSEPGRLLLGASLRDSFLFSLLATLSRVDVTYLRQCPVCSRLFYAKHGRQRFCSTKCKTKEALKRFRKRHREELKKKARANYGQKVRKKPGMKNVKIGTNQKRKTQPKEE